MNSMRRPPRRQAASMLGVFALVCSVQAPCAEPAIVGRVHRIDGATLEVCLARPQVPVVGERVVLIRHAFTAPAKGTPAMTSRTVGAAKIVALTTDRCAQARLTDGEARAQDWVAEAP